MYTGNNTMNDFIVNGREYTYEVFFIGRNKDGVCKYLLRIKSKKSLDPVVFECENYQALWSKIGMWELEEKIVPIR